MTNKPNDPVVVQLARKIFERAIRGQINYEQDIANLKKYHQLALTLNQPRTEAMIINYMAVVNSIAGNLHEAEDLFSKLYEIQKSDNNYYGMATALNNKAVLYSTQGRYDELMALYEQGAKLCESRIAETADIYGLILSGQLSAYLILEDYPAMDACYQHILEVKDHILKRDKFVYARVMSDIYRSMAEYHLHFGDIEKARSTINLAVELARGLDLAFELANAYLTLAHIELAEENTQAAYDIWDEVENVLGNSEAPSHIGRLYLEEARYLQRHNYKEYQQIFAQKSHEIFKQQSMIEDAELAQTLL